MKFLRQVALPVASGLILYAIVWMIENSELGQRRLASAVEALAGAGRGWVGPPLLTSVAIVLVAIGSFAAARWAPLPKSVGIDPGRCDRSHWAGSAAYCLDARALFGAAATDFYLRDGNAT